MSILIRNVHRQKSVFCMPVKKVRRKNKLLWYMKFLLTFFPLAFIISHYRLYSIFIWCYFQDLAVSGIIPESTYQFVTNVCGFLDWDWLIIDPVDHVLFVQFFFSWEHFSRKFKVCAKIIFIYSWFVQFLLTSC